jgi:hypothetical protein
MRQPISHRQGEETSSAPAGEAVFRAILSEDIDWKPFAAFPPSVRVAGLVGQPSEPGPYTIRVKVPRGVKLMPQQDCIYTVISGVFYIGLGDESDANKLEAYPLVAVRSGDDITQCRRLDRWALDTSIRKTSRGIRTQPCETGAAIDHLE